MKTFATVQDLTTFWHAPDDTARAEALIEYESSYLRQIAANNNMDMENRMYDDPIYKRNVTFVILAAVKRALATPADMPPADQWSQAASPYSESMTFTNPSSDLFFKKSELQLLGMMSINGSRKMGVIRGAHG